MIGLRLCAFWRKTTQVKDTINRTTTLDVDLDHLAKAVLVIFPQYNITLLFAFPYYPLWNEVTMHRLHLGSRQLGSTSVRLGQLLKLLGIFLRDIFVSSLSSVYLLNHSYQYILQDVYLTHWVLTQHYIIFLLRTVQFWPL